MFRNGLLATTACVVVGSLSFLLAQSAAAARPVTLGANRDRNAEFLCTYGAFTVSHTRAAASGGSFYSTWTRVAVPFKGHGQTISKIIVMEQSPVSGDDVAFSAGIYNNNAHGKPGTLIARGKGRGSSDCGTVTIPIGSTTLANNTTYWLEETDRRGRGKYGWAVDPSSKKKAYVQHQFSSSNWHSSGHHSSTTPWEKQSSGPWYMLK